MTILRYLGYAAFFLFAFLMGLYLTFPYDAAKDRLLVLVNKPNGPNINAASIEPSWVTGVVARGVEIKLDNKPPIKLERVKARAKIFPLITGKMGFTAQAPLGGGGLWADVTQSADKTVIDAGLEKVQLDLVPAFAEVLGFPLGGKADLDIKMTLGKKDPKLTEGTVKLKTVGLKIDKGAKAGPIPIPPLEIGDVDLSVPFEEGKTTFKATQIKGTDLELSLDGTLSLAEPLGKSAVNLTLGLKPTEKLLSSDPLLRPILNNFSYAKGPDGFYGLQIAGTIAVPRVSPRRL